MSFKCGHIDFGFFSLCSLLGFRHVDHACGLVSLQWLIIILFLFFLFSCFCSCSLSLSISVYVYLFCKMTCTQLASVISFQQFVFFRRSDYYWKRKIGVIIVLISRSDMLLLLFLNIFGCLNQWFECTSALIFFFFIFLVFN